MKRIVFWTAGVVLGVWVAKELRAAGLRLTKRRIALDLNHCSREELAGVPGLNDALADRIIENRPYRHRLDLVARMVLPSGIYQEIRERVDVSATQQVAS